VADLRGLLTSADDLRVDAIAQDPFCAEPHATNPRVTYKNARERGFDYLPVRDADGLIRRVIPTAALENAQTWDFLESEAIPLSADQLVARDAPAFTLLDRLAERDGDLLFCLGRHGVDGVVTVYDLNQPAAHLFGFGLILICEAEVTRTLRMNLGEDPAEAKTRAEEILGHRVLGIRRWERARSENSELHLASSLTFGEKCKLLPRYGLDELALALSVAPAWLESELAEIKDLRNAIAHYDEDVKLADPTWVHDVMRRTHALAQRVAQSRPT
jgi:hypothetical protein